MKMPDHQMRERAVEALMTDRVLTARQLFVDHQVEERALRGLPYKDALVHPVHMRPSEQAQVRFYSLSAALLRNTTNPQLSHFTGTAQIRHALIRQALASPQPDLPKSWKVLGHVKGLDQPDAEFHRGDLLLATEFDTGSYTRTKIMMKMDEYRERYDGVVWGVVSRKRGERLQDRFPDIQVVYDTWWNPQVTGPLTTKRKPVR